MPGTCSRKGYLLRSEGSPLHRAASPSGLGQVGRVRVPDAPEVEHLVLSLYDLDDLGMAHHPLHERVLGERAKLAAEGAERRRRDRLLAKEHDQVLEQRPANLQHRFFAEGPAEIDPINFRPRARPRRDGRVWVRRNESRSTHLHVPGPWKRSGPTRRQAPDLARRILTAGVVSLLEPQCRGSRVDDSILRSQ